jgi:predicted nucleotidyltransferase
MRRDEVIRILQQHRDELVGKFGVKSLALFGSVARDDARDASDVDLLIEFDERPVGYFHVGRTYDYLRKLLDVRHLDLVLRRALLKELKPSILRDAIDVIN